MATVVPVAHMQEEQLSQKDQQILAGVISWVADAAFDPETNICTDAGLSTKRVTLSGMDLVKKFENPIYQIRRVSPFMAKVFNPTNSLHSVTALRIIDGTPDVIGFSARKETVRITMKVGHTIYIRDKVEIMPTVDILFVTSRPS